MNEEILTSLQNPRIKQLVALRESRERKRSGLTRIDGARELLRALDAGLMPDTVFVATGRETAGEVAEALERCRGAGVPIQPVSEAVYAKIRYGDRDEGLCATVRFAPRGLDGLELPPRAFVLVLEGIEKPGNLGALLRSADAAGVDAVILADPACDPANPNVVRASMGTLFTQPVARATTPQVLDFLRERGLKIVTSRPQASTPWFRAPLDGPVAIVAGAEHRGLSAAWAAAAEVDVVLPMAGRADSLNLAAATVVLLYEVVRQRSPAQSGPDPTLK